MKKIIYYIIGVAVLLAAASCQKAPEWNDEGSEQALTLTFTCSDMATRTVAGVSNEDLIKQIDYFFFPVNAQGEVDPTTEYVYSGTLIPTDGGLAGSYTESFQPGVLNKIFPNGNTKAMVFAIANYVDKYGSTATNPVTTIPEDAKTWEALHALEVGQTFFKDGGPGFQLRWPRKMDPDDEDLFFVMAAEKLVTLQTSGQFAIDAKVPLKRLASKVTVDFTYEECTDEKGIKWIPQPSDEETRVYLSNGIEHTTIGGPLERDLVADSWTTATQPLGNGTRDIFEYAYDFMTDIVAGSDGKKVAHYYTYPISMEEGDDNQPYLKLVLPWYGYKNLAGEGEPEHWVEYKQKEVYYKIVLPRETISDPNMIYEFSVLVNIVGSEREVQITGEEYRVKDWSSDEAISSNVGLGRYISLEIPRDEYDMYGDKVQILFVSSGEVEISQLQIYTQDLTGNAPVNEYFINGTPTSYVNPYNANTTDAGNPAVTLPNWVSIQGTQLVINHTLNTNINSSQVDIAPYTFVVTLHLKGVEGTQFDRTVTITQYPPIYAETILTQDWHTVFLNGVQYWQGQTTVNNNASESLGTVGQNGGNTARTRTIVTVTTLANLDVTRYDQLGIGTPVIGDPRITLAEKYPVNPGIASQTWEPNDLGTDANNHISDYLYADVDKANVIAPKFMLASGYGSCAGTKVDWIHNVERCASYQEDGYPAGRWRLPTEAEMVFVYNLAHDLGLLSNPFYSTSNYWSNTGRRYYNGSFVAASSGGNYSSRCVYDLWYWGDEPYDDNGNQIPAGATTAVSTTWLGFMTSK